MAALGRTLPGGLRIGSTSCRLRWYYLSTLRCRGRGQSRCRCGTKCAQSRCRLCEAHVLVRMYVAWFEGRARVGSAALDSSTASGAVGSACRGTGPFLRSERVASHRSGGSSGSMQRGEANQVRQAGDRSTTCATALPRGWCALGSGPRTSSAESARARTPQWTKARSKTRHTLGSRSMTSTNGSTRTP
jgi:hypothetical protein